MNYKFIDNFLRDLLKSVYTDYIRGSNQIKDNLRMFGLVSYEHCTMQLQTKTISFDQIYPTIANSESEKFLYNLKFEEFLFWKELMIDLGLIIVTQNADDKTNPYSTILAITTKGAEIALRYHGNDASM